MEKTRFWFWQIFGGISMEEVSGRLFNQWIELQFFLAFVVAPEVGKSLQFLGQRSGVSEAYLWLVRPRLLSEADRGHLLDFALATFVFLNIGIFFGLALRTSHVGYVFGVGLIAFSGIFLSMPFVKMWRYDGLTPNEIVFPHTDATYRASVYYLKILLFLFGQEVWRLAKWAVVLGFVAFFGSVLFFGK